MRYLLVMASALMLMFGASLVGAEEPDAARDAFERGKELFNAEQYAAAADAFRRANELNPNWRIYYNIGQSEAAARRYGLALEAFEKYLAGGGDEVGAERQAEVLGEVRRLREMVGVLEIAGRDGDLVEVNGVPRGALPDAARVKVGMGDVTLRVVRDGAEVLLKKLAISGGETLTVDVDEGAADASAGTSGDGGEGPVEGDDQRKTLRTVGWIAVGVGAAALVGGGVTGGMALSLNGELADQCGDGSCTVADKQADLDRRDSLATTSTVLLVAGGALAATGVVLLVVGSVGGEQAAADEGGAVALTPTLGPGLAGAALTGRF